MPHCAAVFWGDKLAVVHNLAWGKARGDLDGQGSSGHESHGGEALSSLAKVLRGRTVKVGKHRPPLALDVPQPDPRQLRATS